MVFDGVVFTLFCFFVLGFVADGRDERERKSTEENGILTDVKPFSSIRNF